MKSLLPLLAVSGIMLTGCRVKGVESFLQATTPHDYKEWRGDPYANGGTATASGGLNPQTNYGLGASPNGKPEVSYDAPAKGSGLQPGEEPASGRPWWATQNAPAWQDGPSSVGANGTRVKN